MNFWASAFAARCDGVLHGADFPLRRVSIDSRHLEAGAVFFALRGQHHRGEEFIAAAQARGAIAAVVHEKQNIDLPQLVVADVEEALRALALWKRAQSSARFIGITGSNGKTSSKEMLAAVLATQGKTAATRGNFNNHLGVPLTLAQLDGDEDFVVVEMGANHRGEIAQLCDWVQPEIGLISSISAAHLAGFGDVQGVIETKEALYQAAQSIVLNLDHETSIVQRWEALFGDKIRVRYGLQRGDIWAELENDLGTAFVLQPAGLALRWQRYGRHHVSNALGVAAVVQALGLDIQACAALNGFQMLSGGRMQLFHFGPHLLLDDSYNANPASFKAALQVLSAFPAEQHVFAGGMGEMGAAQEIAHQEVRQEALRLQIPHFYAVECDFYGEKALSKAEALQHLQGIFQAETPQIVLLKGSRSAGMEALRLGLNADSHHHLN